MAGGVQPKNRSSSRRGRMDIRARNGVNGTAALRTRTVPASFHRSSNAAALLLLWPTPVNGYTGSAFHCLCRQPLEDHDHEEQDDIHDICCDPLLVARTMLTTTSPEHYWATVDAQRHERGVMPPPCSDTDRALQNGDGVAQACPRGQLVEQVNQTDGGQQTPAVGRLQQRFGGEDPAAIVGVVRSGELSGDMIGREWKITVNVRVLGMSARCAVCPLRHAAINGPPVPQALQISTQTRPKAQQGPQDRSCGRPDFLSSARSSKAWRTRQPSFPSLDAISPPRRGTAGQRTTNGVVSPGQSAFTATECLSVEISGLELLMKKRPHRKDIRLHSLLHAARHSFTGIQSASASPEIGFLTSLIPAAAEATASIAAPRCLDGRKIRAAAPPNPLHPSNIDHANATTEHQAQATLARRPLKVHPGILPDRADGAYGSTTLLIHHSPLPDHDVARPASPWAPLPKKAQGCPHRLMHKSSIFTIAVRGKRRRQWCRMRLAAQDSCRRVAKAFPLLFLSHLVWRRSSLPSQGQGCLANRHTSGHAAHSPRLSQHTAPECGGFAHRTGKKANDRPGNLALPEPERARMGNFGARSAVLGIVPSWTLKHQTAASSTVPAAPTASMQIAESTQHLLVMRWASIQYALHYPRRCVLSLL
ncbi:hypothetical protein P154DRAFT_570797 [Amniculicola lignicola CBS 123094]|uniref:Uncharacterized protein n=1 Tax=Amniculicola lignicola CBS 123094 TaxID=1392246 RepID=A0A6A5WY59_9PLEO|nr:hypothetical protein P154DRAFT_570797 [Amniculicola lignicola CBS 123094]